MKNYFICLLALGVVCVLTSGEENAITPDTDSAKNVESPLLSIFKRAATDIKEKYLITDSNGQTHEVVMIKEKQADGSRVKRGTCSKCGGGGGHYGGGGGKGVYGGSGGGGGGGSSCSTCGGGYPSGSSSSSSAQSSSSAHASSGSWGK